MGKKSLAGEADTRKEFDSHSTMSSASRASDNKRKSRRFSLRRFFYPQRVRSAKSQTSLEFETRSEFGMTSLPYPERDLTSPCSGKSMDTFNATDGPNFECPLCLIVQPRENFPPIMTCVHRSCMECLRQYLKIEITESRINISCPECSERFHPNDIGSILNNEALMAKYEEFMVRRVLVLDSDTRWCPAPDCGYAVIASGCAGCPKIRCERPGCNTFFCYHCKQHWHPNLTCDTARAKRLPNLHSASISYTDTLSHSKQQPGYAREYGLYGFHSLLLYFHW